MLILFLNSILHNFTLHTATSIHVFCARFWTMGDNTGIAFWMLHTSVMGGFCKSMWRTNRYCLAFLLGRTQLGIYAVFMTMSDPNSRKCLDIQWRSWAFGRLWIWGPLWIETYEDPGSIAELVLVFGPVSNGWWIGWVIRHQVKHRLFSLLLSLMVLRTHPSTLFLKLAQHTLFNWKINWRSHTKIPCTPVFIHNPLWLRVHFQKKSRTPYNLRRIYRNKEDLTLQAWTKPPWT